MATAPPPYVLIDTLHQHEIWMRFATTALQGLLANSRVVVSDPNVIADCAGSIADGMCLQLMKREGTKGA